MPVVFTPCSGAVEIARPNCPQHEVLTIEVDGAPVDAIVTGMTLEMSGNYQFLHSLNELVYFYAFGDRVGTLALTGLGFVHSCGSTGGGGARGGILKLYDYYMSKRAAASENKAMPIVLTSQESTVRLWGFLTGLRIDVNDSQMGVIGYWTLRFDVLPQT